MKLPRGVSGDRLIRTLERLGYGVIRQKGSHVKFVRRFGDVVDTAIVPNKREVPVGTLHSILNQAHITLEQWERLA